MKKFLVVDGDGRMDTLSYFTEYHAAQMARALNMNEGTHYRMYHGADRFSVAAA